nr:hypothetical protein [uncultured Niameybacter sp.]
MMKIDVKKIENWDEIIKRHWEYIENNVKPKIASIKNEDMKEFLTDNLEVIIKGTKYEWDTKIIFQYKQLIKNKESNNNLEEQLQEIIYYFLSSKKKLIDKILEELENKGYNKCDRYQDFQSKLKKWARESEKNEVCRKDKETFLKMQYEQEWYIYEFNKEISKVFDYKKFTTGDKKIEWGRHQLLSMLGIDVCPYCNRNYITYYDEGDMQKTTADLDHYYPKSKYPFLALSLYNFVPSCQICNSRFKLDKEIYSLYPYEEGFGNNAKFRTKFCKNKDEWDINYLLGLEGDFELEIAINENIDEDMKKKIEGSKELFHLEAIYDSHKEYVREIIKKIYCYNDERIEELAQEYPELFKSNQEVIEMVFGNYMIDEERMIQRPLSKLTQDMVKEFRVSFKENTDKIL